MVTAILPTLTYGLAAQKEEAPTHAIENGHTHAISPSISSELTITPARFQSEEPSAQGSGDPQSLPSASSSKLAGFVGMFTGFGALIALALFLPLPAKLQDSGETASEAIADSFYIVAVVAFLVAMLDLVGLRNLPGEEGKTWRKLIRHRDNKINGSQTYITSGRISVGSTELSYSQYIIMAIKLGLTDTDIGLGYLAGFVARASSVAISLFIPLFINDYFISSGQCAVPKDPEAQVPDEIKYSCRRAYILAAILTGTSQLVALLAAPIYGYISSKSSRTQIPLLLAALAGVFGYTLFGMVHSPDPKAGDGTYAIFLLAAMVGLSQIGAIVCSLSLISKGIQKEEDDLVQHGIYDEIATDPARPLNGRSRQMSSESNTPASEVSRTEQSLNAQSSCLRERSFSTNDQSRPRLSSYLRNSARSHETEPLLSSAQSSSVAKINVSRKLLNGSIAGVYSFSGGAGILILTKLGGSLFDSWTPAAPLFLMAIINAVLFVVTLSMSIHRARSCGNWSFRETENHEHNEQLL